MNSYLSSLTHRATPALHLEEIENEDLVCFDGQRVTIVNRSKRSLLVNIAEHGLAGRAKNILKMREVIPSRMEEMLKMVARMDPREALAGIGAVLKRLFANVDDDTRAQFLMDLVGESEGDKVSSMVYL